MNQLKICILKAMAATLISGIMLGFIAGKILRPQNKFKKKANKAVDAVGNLIGSVNHIFK